MKYTEEHLWLRVDDDETVTVGISEYAAEEMGEIVFVELPSIGSTVSRDEELAVVESAKSAQDILAPIDGEVVEVNERLIKDPGKINEDAEGDAWLFRLTIEDEGQLEDFMDEAEYRDYVA